MANRIGEKIKALRKKSGLTQEILAQRIGITKQTISNYETNKRRPDYETLEAIADIFNVNMSTLLARNERINVFIDTNPNLHPIRRIRKVPILGVITCGDPIWAEENFDGFIGIDSTAMDGDFALYAKGDSMIDAEIHSGDLVLLKKTPQVEDGKIAAVYYNREATLKKYYLDKKNKRTILQPCNVNYLPIIIDADDSNSPMILGECVGIYHPIKK